MKIGSLIGDWGMDDSGLGSLWAVRMEVEGVWVEGVGSMFV
jgi:hypothetical protein